ncbi:MAG: 2-phosphosulfolactate phosphatase [Firmicutes bacterium HGW-Firmicutes-14]|jgi:2-phosphosulfolactate phosphatase|nr:MAG: 2-phosphosulfolactate phosphatase [Firmicutes bacterium HGW-Firmicutes-14]
MPGVLPVFVDVIPSPKDLTPQKIYGKTVIVLDIFRCTSTIITALANGAAEVVPAFTPQEALSILARKDDRSTVSAGEFLGIKIEKFDLGNSPLEFTEENIGGKTVILATTNGTRAIRSCKPAKNIFIGSFLNLNSVCSRALGYHRDTVLVCAGTRGNIALEDIMCAGCYVGELVKAEPDMKLSELARTFFYLYEYFKDNLYQMLRTCRSGIRLQKLGYQKDIDFCLQKNRYKIVPIYRHNTIKLSPSLQLT